MKYKFLCSNCATILYALDAQANRTIRCPKCKGVIVIPTRELAREQRKAYQKAHKNDVEEEPLEHNDAPTDEHEQEPTPQPNIVYTQEPQTQPLDPQIDLTPKQWQQDYRQINQPELEQRPADNTQSDQITPPRPLQGFLELPEPPEPQPNDPMLQRFPQFQPNPFATDANLINFDFNALDAEELQAEQPEQYRSKMPSVEDLIN